MLPLLDFDLLRGARDEVPAAEGGPAGRGGSRPPGVQVAEVENVVGVDQEEIRVAAPVVDLDLLRGARDEVPAAESDLGSRGGSGAGGVQVAVIEFVVGVDQVEVRLVVPDVDGDLLRRPGDEHPGGVIRVGVPGGGWTADGQATNEGRPVGRVSVEELVLRVDHEGEGRVLPIDDDHLFHPDPIAQRQWVVVDGHLIGGRSDGAGDRARRHRDPVFQIFESKSRRAASPPGGTALLTPVTSHVPSAWLTHRRDAPDSSNR